MEELTCPGRGESSEDAQKSELEDSELSLARSIFHAPTLPNGQDLFFKIYLFMAVLGFRFCARAFSSCGKWGPLFITVRRPLIIAASLVAEHRLQTRRLSNCGSRA